MSTAGPSRRNHGGEEYEDGEVQDYPSSSSSRHELPSRPGRIRPVSGWNIPSEPAKDWRNPLDKTPPSRSVSPQKPQHPLPAIPKSDSRASLVSPSRDKVDAGLPPRPRSRERSREREKPRDKDRHVPLGTRLEDRYEPGRRDNERGNFTTQGSDRRGERYGDDRAGDYRDWGRHDRERDMYVDDRRRDSDRYDHYVPGQERSERDYRNGHWYDGRDHRDRDGRRRISYASDEDERYGERDRSYRDDRYRDDRQRDRYDEPNGHRRERDRYDDYRRSRKDERPPRSQQSQPYDGSSLPSSQPPVNAAPTPLPPPPDEEDGEVAETSRPNTPSASPPKISGYDAFEESDYQIGFPSVGSGDYDLPSEEGSSQGYKPPKLSIKREYRPVVPLPPTDTPPAPPPPADTPPQPPETPPPGHESPRGEQGFERDVPPPAPNPNILHPSTRPPSPRSSRPEAPLVVSHLPGTYKRRTNGEERNAFGRTFVGTSTLDGYDLGSKLGEGTFGIVTKGVQTTTKRAVALKHLLMHNPRDGVSTTTIREIKILKSLNHPNVVPILDMIVNPKSKKDKSGRQDIFMVFPFMDHDLCGLLGNRDFKPAVSVRKLIMKQMLEGLAYIHANNFVHRDIKTANILVDAHGQVMIADFGLARAWTWGAPNPHANGSGSMPPHTMQEYTNMVVTRWYRAPELLLGDTHYGPAVDMWSMGCILGEMYFREPILAAKGQTDDGQLPLILEHCGPLNDETFPGWQELPGYPDMQGHRWDQAPLGESILDMARRWGMGEQDGHLLKLMLTLDPRQRITADDALDHDWFWTTPMPATVEKTNLGVESSHEMTMRQTHQPVAPAPAYRPQPFHPRPPRPHGVVRPGQYAAQHGQNGHANGFRPGYNTRPPYNGPPNQYSQNPYNNAPNQYKTFNGNGFPNQPPGTFPARPHGNIPPKPMGAMGLPNPPAGPRAGVPAAPFMLAGSGQGYSGPRRNNFPPAHGQNLGQGQGPGQGHGYGGTDSRLSHPLPSAPHAMGLKRAAPSGPSEGREKRMRGPPEPGEVTELPYD